MEAKLVVVKMEEIEEVVTEEEEVGSTGCANMFLTQLPRSR